jgi:peptidoglycan hydrolase CwlO-like protein
VKELEEELHQAEHKLQLKVEQISKNVVDLDQKGKEIKALNEEKDHIQRVVAQERAEFLDEKRSSEAIAARWQHHWPFPNTK